MGVSMVLHKQAKADSTSFILLLSLYFNYGARNVSFFITFNNHNLIFSSDPIKTDAPHKFIYKIDMFPTTATTTTS